MAKPKFDFDDEQNLIRIEGWARDGLDDKQIAANIGYSEAHFSVLKGKLPKLSKAGDIVGFVKVGDIVHEVKSAEDVKNLASNLKVQ